MELETKEEVSISEELHLDQKRKKKLSKKKKIIIGLSIITIILITAISFYVFIFSKESTKETPPEEVPPVEKEEEKKLTIVNEDSNQRPIAVMIDNNIGTGLHAGLQESIINYEIIVEGGYTRIMAIFKDKDVSLIGPVRSARHYFLDYAVESDAIYTHFGHSPYVYDDIAELGVNNINGMYSDSPFWRDYNIAAPHNVFTTTSNNYDFATSSNFATTSDNWQLLNYTTDVVELNQVIEEIDIVNPETGVTEKQPVYQDGLLTANNVVIPYSYLHTSSYVYNSETNLYYRSMNNKAHIDKATNQQLNYKNIIIQKVPNKTLDSDGRQDLTTTGSGEGYYITNGYAIPITWTKSTRSSKTIYTDSAGQEISISDGNTFVHIMPVTQTPVIN